MLGQNIFETYLAQRIDVHLCLLRRLARFVNQAVQIKFNTPPLEILDGLIEAIGLQASLVELLLEICKIFEPLHQSEERGPGNDDGHAEGTPPVSTLKNTCLSDGAEDDTLEEGEEAHELEDLGLNSAEILLFTVNSVAQGLFLDAPIVKLEAMRNTIEELREDFLHRWLLGSLSGHGSLDII